MIILLWSFGLVLFASFLLIVLRGAPYVPTHTRDIEQLFSLYRFKKGDLLVDLGSGDGRLLAAAAERGVASLGYELNPVLAGLSYLRLRRYQGLARVRCEDFWRSQLPPQTVVVFVFLAGPFMGKLDRKLQQEATRLGHDLVLVSYGMKVPNRTIEAQRGGLLVYRYKKH